MGQWGHQAGNTPRSSLQLVVSRPSSVLHHSAGPSAVAAATGSHLLLGELGGCVGRWAPAVGCGVADIPSDPTQEWVPAGTASPARHPQHGNKPTLSA